MRFCLLALTAVGLALGGCGVPEPEPTPLGLEISTPGDTPPAARDLDTPAASPTGTASASASPTTGTAAAARTATAGLDPRNRFYDTDRTPWHSPWYAGTAPVMVPFGCTSAPYYDRDARCTGGKGFHHGTDLALPCGTTVTSGVSGTVLDPATPTRPGPAYGPNALRIRTGSGDVLLGHARRLLVTPGTAVSPGTPLLEVGDLGAPDGCHLHLELRAVGGDVTTASDPASVLDLTR